MSPENDLLQTPQQILDMADAFKKSRVLLSALELDVFSIIQRESQNAGSQQGPGCSVEQVARAAGADERAMDRLLRACCTLGLLQMPAEGLFANTPLTAHSLVRDNEDFLGSVDHLNTLYHTWAKLTPSVRKGGTVMEEPDMAYRDGSWFEPFMAAMYSRGRKNADELVAKLDLAGVTTVLDVGGGPGAHAMAFARAKDDIHAVVYDLPQATPIARRYLRKDGMEHRVTTRDGNFRRDPLHKPDGTGYDLVFVSAIVHMLSPDENRALLRKAYDATAPGGRTVVLDFVMSEDRMQPPFGALFAINMLVSTSHGDSYTQQEIEAWLHEAGLEDLQRIETPGPTAYIQGRRPA